MNLKRLIEISKALRSSDHPIRTFHTTFIVKGSKILSIGINTDKTHPRTLRFNYHCQPKTHSELSAVIKLGKEDCSDFTFINIRLTKDDKTAISKPCSGCMDMLSQVGFKKIIYSIKGDKFLTLNIK